MARRSNRRSSQAKTVKKAVSKSRSTETLEPRVVMSANPISGPMFGTHSMVDEVPAMTQHQAPALEQHSFAPILEQAGLESTPGHDPDADFWLGAGSSVDLLEDLDRQIEQNLREGHSLTGQDQVVDTYGFKGTGQTVAVIDSGIAYNHFALGGGLGSDYRVVGGWDFTENDADFYDDGPSKSAAHGTHVAGIVGAAGGGTHQGVATDVDLVGLRVFDDAGNGYFSWVEQALQWVHTNRNAFDNPITAVNLSLGIEQNDSTVPNWSQLEDEFAQLEADGIFISVSAGNSFANYNTKGLSYPAASPHVIPVMASSNDGTLAPFSQRAENAIAAPGRWITSTVPDYAANDGDTIDDDYLSMSGTSMAAPYVAGASVLIREAMEFARQDANHTDSWGDIDQWDIYNHMIDTAVTFHDSATSTDFKRLDLKAAIDAIIPEDDFGSTIATAHNLGTLDETSSSPLSMISGSITTLDDADHFSFTAGTTGVVTISASNASHAMTASWEAWGGTWSINEAGDCVLDVVAGESYRVGLSSSNGLGYYDLDVSVESTFAAVEWGAISAQETRNWQPTANETWFAVTAGRTGYFTAEAMPQDGSASVAIYDAQQNLIATAGSRADVQATAGETLMLRVTGDASEFDLRMTNAFSATGSAASLMGTANEDSIEFTAGSSTHTLSLNGVSYDFSASTYDTISIDGAGGGDSVAINGSAGDETAVLRVGSSSVASTSYSLSASGYANATFNSGGGSDTATLHGSSGADTLNAYSDHAVLQGSGFTNTVNGADRLYSYAGAGADTAHMHDSSGSDRYYAWHDKVVMTGSGYYNYAWGFDQTTAYASDGQDVARLYDTAGDDVFDGYSTHAVMSGNGFSNRVEGFDQNYAFSSAGNDIAQLRDSAGADSYRAWNDRAILHGNGFYNYAQGFARTYAYALGGGDDHATFNDSAGDDLYYAWHDKSVMAGTGFYNYATGFAETHAYASLGNDVARMYDSAGADRYYAWSDKAVMTGDAFYNYAGGFDQTYAFSSGGGDVARLYDSAGSDRYRGWSDRSIMDGTGFYNYAAGFSQVYAFSTRGGSDSAQFFDSAGSDLFRSYDDRSIANGSGYYNYAAGFGTISATASLGGSDTAIFWDSAGDDELNADLDGVQITRDGSSAEVTGYDSVSAHRVNGGTDNATVASALDYAFALDGGWA